MPWSYKIYLIRTSAGWALEIEDPSDEREPLREFTTAAEAEAYSQSLCRQLRESGDDADVYVDGQAVWP